MKRYDQYCPIACSLGLVGERWTLLVVRELMEGPKRYTDLVAGLPGIGTNILAARLRDLQTAGLVERHELPPPAASTVYELTDAGRQLRPVLHELARFGARFLGPPPAEALEPGWLLGALDLAVSPLAPAARIAFRIGDEEASLVDGAAVRGLADDPDAYVEADATAFYHLFVDGRLDGIHIEGERAIVERLAGAFAPNPEPLPA
ncbi:MAG TPA: helix-turn-helix domain-containing protein [Gaiellaceae bacterium]|nr:helix-turn-helix domain-containing protein [Gaiellaceae bacterium]